MKGKIVANYSLLKEKNDATSGHIKSFDKSRPFAETSTPEPLTIP